MTSRREFIAAAVGAGAAVAAGGCATANGRAARIPKSLGPVITDFEFRRSKTQSGRKAAMYIDDVVWIFRDLTRQRPKSMFDHPFLAGLREAHEKYGLKLQLNCFYRTDFFYGIDEFSLADMTDAYKSEWQASKDWLKLGYHAYQEFPDYPTVNAEYVDVATVFDRIYGEIRRFAGEGVFPYALVGHWLPMSREGCRALKDRGIKLVACTDGARYAYEGDRSVLPYGHGLRIENNRKPEAALFTRSAYDPAILSSLCSYNHLMTDQADRTCGTFEHVFDRGLGIGFKRFRNGPMLNLCTPEQVREGMKAESAREFVCIGDHEQYFYKDYLAYQPDYMEKVLLAARLAKEDGREFIFIEDTAT